MSAEVLFIIVMLCKSPSWTYFGYKETEKRCRKELIECVEKTSTLSSSEGLRVCLKK
jgi:hypothetical protein